MSNVQTLATATADGSGNLFFAPEGIVFSDYYKLELIFEDLIASTYNHQPTVLFYRTVDDEHVFYDVDPNVDGHGVFGYNQSSVNGTGVGAGRVGEDDHQQSTTRVSGVMTLTGMGADKELNGELRWLSGGFLNSGLPHYHRTGTFRLGTDTAAREALTGIRFLFTDNASITAVASGTVRVVGYKD